LFFSCFHFFLEKKRNKENRKWQKLRLPFAGSRAITLIEMNDCSSLLFFEKKKNMERMNGHVFSKFKP